MIDLDALEAEMQMAQQSGRKMCAVHTADLMSLLMRARELEKVQSMVPIQAGFLWPEDLHRMKCGELHRIGLSRKRGPKYCLEARVQYLPSNMKGREFNFDLKALLEAAG
jgi:hypothetical protein